VKRFGVLRFAQDDSKGYGKADGTTTADPCGMTNKRAGNGKDNGRGNGNGNGKDKDNGRGKGKYRGLSTAAAKCAASGRDDVRSVVRKRTAAARATALTRQG
jgi:hypothetical protein